MIERGFQIIDNVFSSEECDKLTQVLNDGDFRRTRAGARNLLSFPAVAQFAVDDRLLRIVRSLNRRELRPYKATPFDKSNRSNWLVAWHQDTALPIREKVDKDGWGGWSMKDGVRFAHAPASALSKVLALRIHLDDSTETNGSLRVIPGSHRNGILTELEIGLNVKNSDAVTCLVDRGGVIVMSPLILHASSKVTRNESRRVLHIEYTESLEIERGIKLAIA